MLLECCYGALGKRIGENVRVKVDDLHKTSKNSGFADKMQSKPNI
jgi:hypothetical protein